MIKLLKCDLEKSLISLSSIAVILVTFGLCLTGVVYTDAEGRGYSVLESLFGFDREFMEQSDFFCRLSVFKSALSGYAAMFIPILAAFPFVTSYCSEKNSGNLRFSIFRTKRICCYISKFLCAALCGGICVALGTVLFGVFAFALFPDMSHYSPETMEFLFPNGAAAEFLKKTLSAFIYGCTNALTAFFLSSFCNNKYIILCVPFILRFIHETAFNKILTNSADPDIYEKLRPFESSAASQIPYLKDEKTLTAAVTVTAVLALVSLLGYIVIMERRTDKGE